MILMLIVTIQHLIQMLWMIMKKNLKKVKLIDSNGRWKSMQTRGLNSDGWKSMRKPASWKGRTRTKTRREGRG